MINRAGSPRKTLVRDTVSPGWNRFLGRSFSGAALTGGSGYYEFASISGIVRRRDTRDHGKNHGHVLPREPTSQWSVLHGVRRLRQGHQGRAQAAKRDSPVSLFKVLRDRLAPHRHQGGDQMGVRRKVAPWAVSCTFCLGGHSYDSWARVAHGCAKCSFTAREPIPDSEVFVKGRMHLSRRVPDIGRGRAK